MIPKEYTQAELKKAWGFGPPTQETPCGGCKHLTSVQGYFYTCNHPDHVVSTCYYGLRDRKDPVTGLQSCWIARTRKPKNINPHNPLGE